MFPNSKVSIILPTLNGSRFIRTSIDSCLGQDGQDLELLVIDGGSTDGTLEIVRSYHDSRLVLVQQAHNAGRISGALNLGLNRMSGSFWTWMQDDSYYSDNAIGQMVGYLNEHTTAQMVYTDYWRIDERGDVIDVISVGPSNELPLHECVGVSFLYRRRVFETIGYYSTKHWLVQDYEYRLRVLRRFSMHPYHVPLYFYRVQSQSLTGRYGLDVERAAIRMKQDLGLMNARQARQAFAEIDLWQGFIFYQRRDIRKASLYLLKALAREKSYIRNRGVLSILVQSMVGTDRAQNAKRVFGRLVNTVGRQC